MQAGEYLTEREVKADTNWKAAIEAFAEATFPYVHCMNSIVGMNTVDQHGVYDEYG